MDPNGTGHLGDADDRLFDVSGGHHHEVVQLVDDDQHERHTLRGIVVLFNLCRVEVELFTVDCQVRSSSSFGDASLVVRSLRRVELTTIERFVPPGDVPQTELGEEVVATFHFLDRPVEGVGRLLWVDDHRGLQVRQPVVLPEFHPLRVNQDHLDLFGGRAHEHRGDEGVHARGLS